MNEKENAIILDGKKYRVLMHEATAECCKDCDLKGLEMCFGICEFFEDYLAEKCKKHFVCFKEVKE